MSERKSGTVKCRILHIAAVLLMFLCMAVSLSESRFPKPGKDIRIILEENGISGREAVDIQARARDPKEGFPEFTVWSERQGATVRNQELGREGTASLLTVCGDSRLVLDGISWIDYGGNQGCLIDEALSWQLFGSVKGVGEEIQVGEQTYLVNGILHDAENTVMVQARGEEEEKLDRISVEIPGGTEAGEVVRKLSNQFGFSQLTVNYEIYRFWGRIAARILPCILGVSVLFSIRRRAVRCKGRAGAFIICVAEGMLFLALFLWILDIRVKIPGEMIPSKWSDFEFWAKLWQQKQEEFRLLLYGAKTKPESLYLDGFIHTLAYSGAALVFWCLSLCQMQTVEKTKKSC